jgi:SAM-dependent methyltransferase
VESAGGCPLCSAQPLEALFRYDSPPPGETRFELPEGAAYHREFRRCRSCGHQVSVHQLDLSSLYSGVYVDATYGDRMHATYERIMALPLEASDNLHRVERIDAWWNRNSRTVLDVGSGLAVFPARMKQRGWEATALDPDPRAADHAREVGVLAVCADFMHADELGEFDLVTFNKVLEHVPDPVAMLERSRSFLRSGGAVYVEVPDGELAAGDPEGPNREEFFIEHLFAFSMASLCLLADRAGFIVRTAERLREPSGKYTLYAFLVPRGAADARS